MLCQNPAYIPLHTVKDYDVNQVIDEIEYPTINDISMKDSVASFRMDDEFVNNIINNHTRRNDNKPSVDRKSKINAVIRYEKQELSQVFHAQEKLAEKALDTSKKLLNSEQEWKRNELMRESGVLENKRDDYSIKEQKYLYQILELEAIKDDYVCLLIVFCCLFFFCYYIIYLLQYFFFFRS